MTKEQEYLTGELELKESQVEDLKEEEKGLNKNISELTIELNKAQFDLHEKTDQLDILEEELLQVTAALNAAEVRASDGTLIFVKNQELKRLMIPEGLDSASIKSYLEESFEKLIEDSELLGVSFAFETSENLTLKAIQKKENGNHFLRIMSSSNVFVGDAIKVDFEWIPVHIVFQEGEVLLDRFFTETSIVENNYIFLESLIQAVEDIAKTKGIFPDVKTQKRVFFPSWKLTNRAEEMVDFKEGVLVSIRITKTLYNFESVSKIEVVLEGR